MTRALSRNVSSAGVRSFGFHTSNPLAGTDGPAIGSSRTPAILMRAIVPGTMAVPHPSDTIDTVVIQLRV